MLVTRSIWRYHLWKGWWGLAGEVMRVWGMLGHMRSYTVWVRWILSFCSSSLSCIYVKEVLRWSSNDSTYWRFGGWGRLVLWGSWCWDFRLIDQTAKEQEGCHREGIVKESFCWGCYLGGRGQYEIPLPSSFQLLRLDFLPLSLNFLISPFFVAIAWMCIVTMLLFDWYYPI